MRNLLGIFTATFTLCGGLATVDGSYFLAVAFLMLAILVARIWVLSLSTIQPSRLDEEEPCSDFAPPARPEGARDRSGDFFHGGR